MPRLITAAEARGIEASELAGRLLELIAIDHLIDAILDDRGDSTDAR
jgi:hypothetical protein